MYSHDNHAGIRPVVNISSDVYANSLTGEIQWGYDSNDGAEKYNLGLAAYPSESGSVTDNTDSGPYKAGAEVNIAAEANEGYEFVNWTLEGVEVSKDASFTYIMPMEDIILVANFASTSQEFAGGSGTESDPWQVKTAEHLDNLRFYTDSMINIEHDDKYFLLMNDIDLGVSPWSEGEGWLPIGGTDGGSLNPFYGSFDGGGFAIHNLFIDRPGFGNEQQGLFADLRGEIKNLRLEDVSIASHSFIGSLAGSNSGSIINCSSDIRQQTHYHFC